jgi:hypothetical protein
MPEELNVSAENTALEGVVAESQTAGDDIDGQEEGLDLETPAGAANTEAKKNPTQKYSERLNRDREAMRKQYEDEYAPIKTRMSELEIENKALKEGKSVDEIRAEQAEQEKTRQELIQNDPEVQRLRTMAVEQQKAKLLDELRTEFPDDNITGIDDLGDDYKRMLMSGVHPFTAYMAIRDMNVKNQPPKKELPGSVKSDGNALPKEFYTREEVEAMSVDEVAKNYDAVIASQKKWK